MKTRRRRVPPFSSLFRFFRLLLFGLRPKAAPSQAGIQEPWDRARPQEWIPAFAGMTFGGFREPLSYTLMRSRTRFTASLRTALELAMFGR